MQMPLNISYKKTKILSAEKEMGRKALRESAGISCALSETTVRIL